MRGVLLAAALLIAPAAALLIAPAAALASEVDWAPLAEEDVVVILTFDPDGDLRETPVWVVVADDAAWVRTNDSRWLANLRRDPSLRIRVRGSEIPLRAAEVSDPDRTALVEEAFRAKYGWMQRVMSALRLREPTVLRLEPPAP